MYAWLPIGPTEGTKQLILPVVPQRVMYIHQQLCMGHKWWYIHPMPGRDGCGWEKDLQFIAACLIHLPQLPKSVHLIHVVGQPAHPEVVNQKLILSHIYLSPGGYYTLTRLTKPWPIMQMHAAGLSNAVFMVTVVAPVVKYLGG